MNGLFLFFFFSSHYPCPLYNFDSIKTISKYYKNFGMVIVTKKGTIKALTWTETCYYYKVLQEPKHLELLIVLFFMEPIHMVNDLVKMGFTFY